MNRPNDIGRTKHAAHFLLLPELLYSPPNRAIIEALLELGYQVHVFAPGRMAMPTDYGDGVQVGEAAYSMRLLVRQIVQRSWRKFDVFSATAEDPFAFAGVLAYLYRKPSFLLVDEIKSGSYRGDSPERTKRLCRWAMRKARFNIVNDDSRVALLREYAELPESSRVIVYPGCFHEPPEADPRVRAAYRTAWGLPQNALVMAASGAFNLTVGADWLIQALQERTSLHGVLQPVNVDPFSTFLLKRLNLQPRVYLQEERMSWTEAWRSAVALDIGLSIYTSQGPQFQHMGISSNRLCMFIAMGVPVICSRQPSFEFVEKYDCGVMVGNYAEFLAAIDYISANLERMRINCRTCFREYIMPSDRFPSLKAAIASVA